MQNGITLIALVISIIVMLILAGVSISAIVGEDGILSKAQMATYLQSCAVLEEWLQMTYTEFYDEEADYINKVDLLNHKIPNLLHKDGVNNYITYDGLNYFLINKAALPDDLRKSIKGGDVTEYSRYIRLYDVYGVTPDLKVYYCDKSKDIVLGNMEGSNVDPNIVLGEVNSNTDVQEALKDALADLGINVDDEVGITSGNVAALKSLELDGSKQELTSLAGIGELYNLKSLVIKNVTLESLSGIENLQVLNYIYFYNCNISDYSALTSIDSLQYLYMYLPSSMTEAVANAQVTNLGLGLKNASSLNKLETLGIAGTVDLFTNSGYASYSSKTKYASGTKSKLTDISGLNEVSGTVKNSVKHLILNNNSITSLNGLEGFLGAYEIFAMSNTNLEDITALINHSALQYLILNNCKLLDLQGLTGCSALKDLWINNNTGVSSFAGLAGTTRMENIAASNCSITDITGISGNSSLKYLNLEDNVDLINVSTLGNFTQLTELYLKNNEDMLENEVKVALANESTHILQNCGKNYSIPQKYLYLFKGLHSYIFKDMNLTDTSTEIANLKGDTNVVRLDLSGNPELSDEKLQEILSTLTNLEDLSLNGCQNLKSINFIGSGKVTKLVELDLRGTSSELVDLSNLNAYSSNLVSLIIDNPGISMKDIQITLNNLASDLDKTLDLGISNENSLLSSTYYRLNGLVLIGDVSEYDFSECSSITNFFCMMDYWRYNKVNTFTGTLDLSGCTALKNVKVANLQYGIKFPRNLEQLLIDNHHVTNTFDLSLCKDMTYLRINWLSKAKIDSTLATLSEGTKIETLMLSNTGLEDLTFLGEIDASSVKNLTLTIQNTAGTGANSIKSIDDVALCTNLEKFNLSCNNYIEDISVLGNCTHLKELTVYKCRKLKNLTGIANCSLLTSINASNSIISDISALENLTSLTKLVLDNNKLSSLTYIAKLKNLENLTLHDNFISDLSPLEALIDDTGKIKFTELDLSNNTLQRTSASGYNNVECLKKLYTAGLRKINIAANNFVAGSTDELKTLYGENYSDVLE